MKSSLQTVFLLFLLTFTLTTQAQDLREHTGVLDLKITITNQDTVINNGIPILVRRAESNNNTSSNYETSSVAGAGYGYGSGYGFGYASWHLEFVGTKDLRTIRKKYQLSFMDQSGEVIGFFRFDQKEVDVISTKSKAQFFYSIDMIDVPILLVEQTTRIEIKSF